MNAIKVVARIVLAAMAYVIGTVVMGMLSSLLHLPLPKSIPGGDPQRMFLTMLLASPLLIIALLPLAAELKGSWAQRCLAIGGLLYVTLGLNTLLEMKIFTSLLDGSPWLASLQWVLPCVLTGAALTYRSGETRSTASALGSFGTAGWTWRLGLAWLSFPVIYFLFGMCVAPFVVPYYNSHDVLGLKIPGFDVIIRMQLLRSAIFFAASFPFLILWTKSRSRLFLALGLAHATTVGVFQLAQAWFLPMTLRVAHSLEITADSFAYAAVLTYLFTRKAQAVPAQLKSTSAAAD